MKIIFKNSVLQQYLPQILQFKPFLQWQKEISNTDLQINSIEIQDLDYFHTRIGFLKFRADCRFEDGTSLPGIVFSRGESVAIFLIIKTPTTKYVVLVEQMRVPVGKTLLELPAGMIDDDNCIKSVALKELEEECGITIEMDQLTKLSRLCPSPGGCDEFMTIYSSEIEKSNEECLEINNRLGGLRQDGERIKLKLTSFDELYGCESMPILAALALYNNRN